MREGSRVRVTEARDESLVGLTGTVRCTRKDGQSIGVEFDSNVGGHSLNGRAMNGYGRWLSIDQLVRESNYDARASRKEETMSCKNALRTVSTFAKAHLDKDVIAFIKLGWMTSGLEVTSAGEEALDAFLFDANKSELGKIARAEVKAIKKDK